MAKALKVFTNDSLKDILKVGGSGYWRLDKRRASRCEYIVAVRNPDGENSEGSVKPRAAFLIGKVESIQAHKDRRSIVIFSEYALIDVPRCWDGSRNPVAYTSIEEVGIDLGKLEGKWIPVGKRAPAPRPSIPPTLTILEAKHALAESLGVRPEQVEINIRA